MLFLIAIRLQAPSLPTREPHPGDDEVIRSALFVFSR